MKNTTKRHYIATRTDGRQVLRTSTSKVYTHAVLGDGQTCTDTFHTSRRLAEREYEGRITHALVSNDQELVAVVEVDAETFRATKAAQKAAKVSK